MKTLLVMAHPRTDSLTASVADIFAGGLEKNGHRVEWANLVEEGFDPVQREADEPDWNDPDKRYSPEVQREMERIERNEANLMGDAELVRNRPSKFASNHIETGDRRINQTH